MTAVRRQEILAGAAAGLVSALALAFARRSDGAATLLPLDSSVAALALHLAVGVALGAALGAVFRYQPQAHAATISGGLLLGLLWWIAGPITLAPILDGRGPTWSLVEGTAALPSLIVSVLFGGLAGVGFHLLAGALPGAVRERVKVEPPRVPSLRVVILGGGFGGVAAAQRLERLYARDATLEITLVSDSNYLLFTPMLAEVASSALQAQHISAPVRAACPRTRFRRDGVAALDPSANAVRLVSGETLAYDQLVLALGAEADYRGLPGMEEHSFALKTLHDATELRNHVLGQLERADAEEDEDERRLMLTFVVVGGGFAGTEMVAELFDLAHIVLRYYPRIEPEELRFVLVHSRDRILPELGAELAAYALDTLRRRGIEFLLEKRVAGATQDGVLLTGGESVPSRTVVWTAGNRPSPLLATLPCEHSRTGALIVDDTLRARGLENVWAVGDCAQIPDPDRPGEVYPPTAQHALREGKIVADNVAATLRGKQPQPFRFRTIGTLVALGHRTAVAEIRGRRFSGLLAWFLWRGVYWSKLPGFEKKLRVLLDWTIDLFFPRDIVLTTPRPTPTLAETIHPGRTPELVDAARDG